jgi:hypothetical protein
MTYKKNISVTDETSDKVNSLRFEHKNKYNTTPSRIKIIETLVKNATIKDLK